MFLQHMVVSIWEPLHDLTRRGDLTAHDTDGAIVESLSRPFDDVGVLDQDVELGQG